MDAPSLEQLLTERRDEIVARFVREVRRKDLPPPGLSTSHLENHIPRFLDEILVELRGASYVRASQDAIDTSPTARRHGGQRWSLGYDIEALVREYGILRHVILEAAREASARIVLDEFDVLAKCLNVGVAEAASAYVEYRDQELAAQRSEVEFLAEAGRLLSSSLDHRSTLTRVTRLIVPRLADWCAIRLEGTDVAEMPILHVDPAKIDVLREIYRRFPMSEDSAHGYREVLRTGRSQLVAEVPEGFLDAATQSAQHLELLKIIDSCSWMIVPLMVQENLFGAIVFAYSDSRRRYRPADLVLAEELARRAAAAIDNARLYELSQQARSRVEAATRAKDEFVAVISHELRTPLNAMLGWMRLQRSGALPEAKREHAFNVIERNANALNQLVADLLDISRVISGSIRLNPTQVDLYNVVDMAIEGARPALEGKRLGMHTDLERTNAVIRADGDRLQQVVWNLLTNAIKFTPKGGDIWISLRRVNSDVELVVRDNGTGISPEFLPRVFESFRQSDSTTTRHHGGLGVGLSIAKHLVDLHGGSIEAESAGVGLGAKFTVTLPVSAVVSTTLRAKAVPATTRPHTTLPDGLEGLRVLVVDDEEDARELLRVLLETRGMEVRTATTAEQALAEAESFAANVIISDIGMPGDDGYVLIRRIRTLPDKAKARTPAIALTAYASSADRSRALVEGFNVHLAKPVEPAELLSTVAELTGRGPVPRSVVP